MFAESQHSGTAEDEYNDLDGSKGDLNSSIDPDQESADEESYVFQCPVCERDCIDLEQ